MTLLVIMYKDLQKISKMLGYLEIRTFTALIFMHALHGEVILIGKHTRKQHGSLLSRPEGNGCIEVTIS